MRRNAGWCHSVIILPFNTRLLINLHYLFILSQIIKNWHFITMEKKKQIQVEIQIITQQLKLVILVTAREHLFINIMNLLNIKLSGMMSYLFSVS
jgi:hypothetical protein